MALSGWTALVGAPQDTVGTNTDQGSAYPFLLDGTAPTTTASGLQTNASSGWIKTSQAVTLTPADTGGSAGGHLLHPGWHAAHLRGHLHRLRAGKPHDHLLVDRQRRQHRVHPHRLCEHRHDRPGYERQRPADERHTGWIKTSQAVTLTPADTGGSGLAATYYTLDGRSTPTPAPSPSPGRQATRSPTGRPTTPATRRPPTPAM